MQPFELQRLDGGSYEWKPGKTTVVTVIAYWCDTWKTQYKRLDAATKALNGLPFDTVAISLDGRWAELARKGSWGTLLTDPGGSWSRPLGIDRVPYTFVIDPRGTVKYSAYGIVHTEELKQRVRSAIDGATESGPVYLAFDDFPQPTDDELLDRLRRLNAPATFFCICSKLESQAVIAKRAAAEGHSLQVHGWDHTSEGAALDRCSVAIQRVTGKTPTLYRPPGSEQLVELRGKPFPAPEVDPYDFLRPSAKEITRRVLLGLKPGCVIHLHSGVRETLDALPEIVENVRARGFTLQILK